MDKRFLIESAFERGIALGESKAELLIRYARAVLEKNKVLNLTAITDETDFAVKHLLDSLTVAALPEIDGSVADVGTGGGFPGAVIKIYKPELPVTLIDSAGKKVTAVAEICESLGIKIKPVHARAEEIGRREYRGIFDAVVARAVAPLPRLLEYCIPLVKKDGYFVAMKGAGAVSEIELARRAEQKLKSRLKRTVSFTLPGDMERLMAVYRKSGETPEAYPRTSKRIAADAL